MKEIATLNGLFLKSEETTDDGWAKYTFIKMSVVKKTIVDKKVVTEEQQKKKKPVQEESKVAEQKKTGVVMVDNPFDDIDLGTELVNEDDLLDDLDKVKDFGG